MQNSTNHTSLSTGLKAIDHILGGMRCGDLLLVAGGPGVGKSSLLTAIMLNVARAQHHVVLFNREMSEEQQLRRMVAVESGLSLQRILWGDLTAAEKTLYSEALHTLSGYPACIDTTPSLCLSQLCDRVRTKDRCDLVLVDCLHQLSLDRHPPTSAQELNQLILGLKQLAFEMNIPVVAVAHVSAGEEYIDKRPTLSALEGIDRNVDVVMFLSLDQAIEDTEDTPIVVEVEIAKHRDGPTGVAKLSYTETLTKFTDLA